MPTADRAGGARALRLGTRGSALALAQSGAIARRIEALGFAVETIVIRTSGDKLADVSLAKVGGKGLFLKEIEEALTAGEIDLAVHSMKDVPAELAPGFALAAVPARADVRDVLVPRESQGGRDASAVLAALPAGERIATGSLRRRALIAHLRPDLEVVPMRGNVDTRLRKLRDGAAAALVLAAAGLARLGIDPGALPLDAETFLPAPGQGALALEVRAGDELLERALAPLDDRATRAACAAERSFLRALGASCQVPVAAHARALSGSTGALGLDGLVASLDGARVLRDRVDGPLEEAEQLGEQLGARLLARGARAILEQAEREVGAS